MTCVTYLNGVTSVCSNVFFCIGTRWRKAISTSSSTLSGTSRQPRTSCVSSAINWWQRAWVWDLTLTFQLKWKLAQSTFFKCGSKATIRLTSNRTLNSYKNVQPSSKIKYTCTKTRTCLWRHVLLRHFTVVCPVFRSCLLTARPRFSWSWSKILKTEVERISSIRNSARKMRTPLTSREKTHLLKR